MDRRIDDDDLEHDRPADRQRKPATSVAIADLLAANLKPDCISRAMRTAAPAYDGRTALQAIADGDEDKVIDELRSAFDWTSTA